MENNIYKKIEIVGSSEISSDDAVKQALKSASSSIQNLRWFEVIESRGSIKEGNIEHWQVTIKIGFTMKSE
jgi:flavin-binding protein dodecin